MHTKNIPIPKSKAGNARLRCRLRDLQAVERDFAFVVDQSVEAMTLVNAAMGADKALIEDVMDF